MDLGCFHVLAVVNSAAMNIVVHDSFWIMVFSGHMLSSGIAGSYHQPLLLRAGFEHGRTELGVNFFTKS